MNKGIWATLDPFVESGPEILGRSVANTCFLEALLRADPFPAYHFFLRDQGLSDSVGQFLGDRFPDLVREKRVLIKPRPDLPQALRENDYHCFHLSDCINYPAHLAALRNKLSPELFPVTGLTHSLSYARYAEAFLAHIWPGCTSRDAVVATSTGAVKVVESYYGQLQQAYGLSGWPRPAIRRVPLGVDVELHQPAEEPRRQELRSLLHIGPDQTVFLVFGRVSIFSKMDLLPLLRVFRRLFDQGLPPRRVVLIMAGACGRTEDGYVQTLKNLAANIKLDLRLELNPSDQRKIELYQASDALVSISDNVQETFGLVLLEAGACGLPVIASDYDGYRDLVITDKTGRLVPTVGPSGTNSLDDLAHVWFDSQTHLSLAQATCVDPVKLAQALDLVVSQPDTARLWGERARRHVSENYAWDRIIAGYIRLWEELWAGPVQDEQKVRAARHPLHLSYSRLFGAYPSQRIDDLGPLTLSQAGQAVYHGRDFLVVHDGLEEFLQQDILRRLLFLARKPIAAEMLLAELGRACNLTPEQAEYHLLHALKHDLLEEAGGPA